MRLTISHTTLYTYDAPVRYGLSRLRLTPGSDATQTVLSWKTEVEGGQKQVSYFDHFHNKVELVSLLPEAHEIRVRSEGQVDTRDCAGVAGEHAGFAPLWLFCRETDLTAPGAQVSDLARSLGDTRKDPLSSLHALSRAIGERVAYHKGATTAASSVEDVLAAGKGVCQDHAHVFVSAARVLGLPARYVSGYLMMDEQVDQDATHAWGEAYVQGLGWVGFDVSNEVCPDERYVRVAT
ncbi:MAG: transglutaminase family protein, partial [Myxococcales bacterium]|nr:transglutaminase family protein [Myxococcales bacterium]